MSHLEKGSTLPETEIKDVGLNEEDVQIASDTALDRKILLKIDSVVLTLLTLVATFEFLDKNGMAYAAVWGMKTDANLVGQQYSWLGR